MSSTLSVCRHVGKLLQASCLRPVRTLCQEASKEMILPSGDNSGANSGNSGVRGNVEDVGNFVVPEEDMAKVVQLVNTASEASLSAVKHISSSMAAGIVLHRRANGPFASVSDLLKVHGIGHKTLQRICRGILRPSLQVDVGEITGSPRGTHQVGVATSRIESVRDVVAVDVGLRHLSWVHMSRDRRVLEWRVKDITGVSAAKWNPPAYLSVVTSTIAEMPKPDLYVLEHKSFSTAQKGTFQIILFQRTLQGMLYAALNHDREDTGTLRAISLSQIQVGRHFDLQVGGTRMSGQDIVANLLDGTGSEDDDLPAKLTWEDADTFQTATKLEKEHLSNCLLQAITFYNLFVDSVGKS